MINSVRGYCSLRVLYVPCGRDVSAADAVFSEYFLAALLLPLTSRLGAIVLDAKRVQARKLGASISPPVDISFEPHTSFRVLGQPVGRELSSNRSVCRSGTLLFWSRVSGQP